MLEKIKMITKDNLILNGLLSHDEVLSLTVVIMVHGITSSMFNQRCDIFEHELLKNGYDFFAFNNRGFGNINLIPKTDGSKQMLGTSYEDVFDAKYDLESALDAMISYGYKKICFLGHSLGATKVLYYLNTLKNENKEKYDKYIGKIGLMSLVDFKDIINDDKLPYTRGEMINYIVKMKEEGKDLEMAPSVGPLKMISVKTLSSYIKATEQINYVDYANNDFTYDVINSLQRDIFIRYGTDNELLNTPHKQVINNLKNNINKNEDNNNNNLQLDVDIISGANHSYVGYEEVLINQFIKFLKEG